MKLNKSMLGMMREKTLFDMAGMQLPEYLGKPKAEPTESVEAE